MADSVPLFAPLTWRAPWQPLAQRAREPPVAAARGDSVAAMTARQRVARASSCCSG